MAEEKRITPMAQDFSAWYIDVIKNADLMDYAPVRGCMIFKPAGYALWEAVQRGLDRRFKETGHENAYFPMLIPESFFMKEKEHVEGFAPELPWVTEAAGEKLEERLALRPTSETVIGWSFQKWIQSYRDLPVLVNQWANVFRWEKRTLPFLRTSEFLWQEGHTAHADEKEAREETIRMLNVYVEFAREEMALPVWEGQKTPSEKFAGAVDTYSIEAMMKDGKAVQAGTSHYMGTKFAEAFNIQYLDRDQSLKHVHTTSWGVSTRLIGCLIMAHGDDKGLRLPPRMAPVQMVMIPVGPAKLREKVMAAFNPLVEKVKAAGIRVKADAREEYSPGWKYNEYEMRGVPLRLEIGPRDIDNNVVVIVRRDTGEKLTVSQDGLTETISALLEEVQQNMYQQALAFRQEHSFEADALPELAEILDKQFGFVLGGWCGNSACEEEVKKATKATARNRPFNPPKQMPRCIACGQPSQATVWYARSY